MRKKHIVLDCDGVLLNCTKAFYKFIEPVVGKLYDWKVQEHFYYYKDVVELTKETASEQVAHFLSSPVAANLEVFNGVKENLDKLKQQGFSFSILSACLLGDDNNLTIKYRNENLDKIFGKDYFQDRVYVESSTAKQEFLEKHKQSFYVEDRDINCLVGEKMGLFSILIDAPYNRGKHVENRVSSWDEISDLIIKNYK